MKFRNLMLVCMCLILSGCGSTTVQQEVLINTLPDQSYTYYKNPTLQLQYPKGFVAKTKTQIADQYSNPVELLFESEKQGPIMKSLILVEAFSVPVNANKDATIRAFYESNKSRLLNYVEFESEIFNTVVDNQYFQTELKHFQGRRNLSGNDMKFFQTYLIKGDKLYMVTAAFDPNDPFMEGASLRESMKTMTIF